MAGHIELYVISDVILSDYNIRPQKVYTYARIVESSVALCCVYTQSIQTIAELSFSQLMCFDFTNLWIVSCVVSCFSVSVNTNCTYDSRLLQYTSVLRWITHIQICVRSYYMERARMFKEGISTITSKILLQCVINKNFSIIYEMKNLFFLPGCGTHATALLLNVANIAFQTI